MLLEAKCTIENVEASQTFQTSVEQNDCSVNIDV